MPDLPPVPPTPIDMERTYKKVSKTTYSTRANGTVKKDTTVEETRSYKVAPGKEFRASNGDNFLQAKLRPTGLKLDLAPTAGDTGSADHHQPHYK